MGSNEIGPFRRRGVDVLHLRPRRDGKCVTGLPLELDLLAGWRRELSAAVALVAVVDVGGLALRLVGGASIEPLGLDSESR